MKPDCLDLGQAVEVAKELMLRLREGPAGYPIEPEQQEEIYSVMESLMIMMMAEFIALGVSSFDCPDVAVRLQGWRKR